MKKAVLFLAFVMVLVFAGVAGVAYAGHQRGLNSGYLNKYVVAIVQSRKEWLRDSTSPDAVSNAAGQTANLSAGRSANPEAGQSGKPSQVRLDVPAIEQGPELYNGCEVTSLSMLLAYEGHPVDKTELASDVVKDPTPEVRDDDGNTLSWGDPNLGFVGDVWGANRGYGVYHGPVTKLLDSLMPGKADDLTGQPFDAVLRRVAAGHPVLVWTTVGFSPTTAWETWEGPEGAVRATLDEHAVLVVGFTDKQILVNDPLDGSAAKAVDKDPFIAAWKQLGQQAVACKSPVQ